MSHDEKSALGVFIGLGCLVLIGWGYTIPESGFPGKTLWDWMQLAVIPLALAVIAYVFSRSEKRNEITVAQDNQREAALQSYFDRMSELLLKENLREAESTSEVRAIARSITLATLRRLDGERKGSVVRFLKESGLINRPTPMVYLGQADLRTVDLRGASLEGIVLAEADLRKSNLTDAILIGADLTDSNLGEANLSDAHCSGANLRHANLQDAILCNAYLGTADWFGGSGLDYIPGADMVWADLSRANMKGAVLGGVDLTVADLTGAIVTSGQLRTVKSLKGTTLPDGSRVPDDEDTGQPS